MEHAEPWKLKGGVSECLRDPLVVVVLASSAQGLQGWLGKPGEGGCWA